jgi:putative phage-type endonuclease
MKPSIYVPLTQSTPEWHAYRAEGIGASEAAILMGVNPYKTIFDLWNQKTATELLSEEPNENMKNGIELEDRARKEFMTATGLKVEPKCFINPKYSFIRASLDGITEDHKIILEIKCPVRQAIHCKVIKGTLPSYYYPQLQHQLLTVPEAEEALYWSYMKSMGGFLLEFGREEAYIKEMIKREKKFWKAVQTKTAPDPKDYELFESKYLAK